MSDHPSDDKILSLFRDWVTAQRMADALFGENGESAEFKALDEAADKIERTLIEIPSNGATGLAIKSYLALHAKGGGAYEDIAALHGVFALIFEVDAAILKDAIRFRAGARAARGCCPRRDRGAMTSSASDTAPSGGRLLIAWGAARLSRRLLPVAERMRWPGLALAALWAGERCAGLARRLLAAAAALMLIAGTAGAAEPAPKYYTPKGAECADHPPVGGCPINPAVDPFKSDDKLIFYAAQLCALVAFENPAVQKSAQLAERAIENCSRYVNGTPRDLLKNYVLRLCSQITDYSVCASENYDK